MAFEQAYYRTPLIILFQYLKYEMRQEALDFFHSIIGKYEWKTVQPFFEKVNRLSPDYDDTEDIRKAKIEAKMAQYIREKSKKNA